MTCRIVIPAKAPAAAKGRLAGVLSHAARADLARRMLERVIAAVTAAGYRDRLALTGVSRLGADEAIELLAEPEGGLNAALTAARHLLAQRGAARLVSLAGDLPGLTGSDVAALCELPRNVIGLAPDRHGTGTNALSLPLPAAARFNYAYGPGSRAAHEAEAQRLGLELRLIETTGLARDVDEPADLTEVADLLAPQKG